MARLNNPFVERIDNNEILMRPAGAGKGKKFEDYSKFNTETLGYNELSSPEEKTDIEKRKIFDFFCKYIDFFSTNKEHALNEKKYNGKLFIKEPKFEFFINDEWVLYEHIKATQKPT